ncbi:hypothetical protein OROMI_023897 [Orobanche minor]
MPGASVTDLLGALNKDSFVSLLSKLIGESKHVQNNPPDLIPEEDRIVRHVLNVLHPFSAANGGPLVVKHVAYKPNRGNLIVEYPGTQPRKILSFVGMHMDVVTANPSDWNSSIPGVGIDALVKDGLLDKIKQGPLFWIDTAINPLELAMEALRVIQLRFYKDFPPHPNEKVYEFATPSTTKPTQWNPGGGINQIPAECTVSGDVRLTPFYSVSNVMEKLQEYVEDLNANIEKMDTRGPVSKYVLPDENLRGRMTITFDEALSGVACDLDSRGFHVLCNATKEVVGHVKPYSITGSLPLIRELQTMTITFDEALSGVACDLDSRGFHVLCNATKEVVGHVKPYSITGSLPLIRELQTMTITFDEALSGVACDLDSRGFHVLCNATKEVVGHVKPYSITGSLPLIRELQTMTITFDEALSGVACDLDSRGFHVLCNATKEVVGHVKPYSITGSLPLIRELQAMTITFDEALSGVACDLDSRGFHVLCNATKEVVGHVKPYSITGSLPLIRELQAMTITFDEALSGVACDLDSRGFHVLCNATKEVVGHVKPYSITGSLPLIRELQTMTITFDEALSGVACDLDSRGFHVLCNATKEVVGHVKPYSITGSLPLIRELQTMTITFDEALSGVACDLDSRGFHVLCNATKEVVGHVKPYSITGSLPLIRELQTMTITFDEALSGVACDLDSRGFHVLCNATKEVVGHVKPYSITGSLPLIRELQTMTITFDEALSGVACDLDSRGFHVLCNATKEVVGHVKPYSITGSLPLIRELQDEGFDVQTSGYGLMATYHAKNEYCLLSDMCQGYGVFVRIIAQLEDC